MFYRTTTPKEAAQRMNYRFGALALLLLTIPPLMIQAQSSSRVYKGPGSSYYDQMLITRIQSVEITSAIRALPELNLKQMTAKFLLFTSHINDQSEIVDHPAGNGNSEKKVLPFAFQVLIQQSLEQKEPRGYLLRQASLGQWLNALESLEIVHNYYAAALLAQALIDKASDASQKDLLALVAARNQWIVYGAKAPQYKYLIDQAANSATTTTAVQGRLWKEALTAPQSLDALDLSYRIWKAAWVDMGRHQSSFFLSSLIAENGPRVYDKVLKSEGQAVEKDRMLGRILAITSRAAFRVAKGERLKWATSMVKNLKSANPEDRLSPHYYYAGYMYAANQFPQAVKEFEKVFFSGTVCDTAADAGFVIADCYEKMDDTIGAIATLEMMNNLYSTRKMIMPKAYRRLESLRQRVGALDPAQISQYIEKNFKIQYQRALAEKNKSNPARELAGLIQ